MYIYSIASQVYSSFDTRLSDSNSQRIAQDAGTTLILSMPSSGFSTCVWAAKVQSSWTWILGDSPNLDLMDAKSFE